MHIQLEVTIHDLGRALDNGPRWLARGFGHILAAALAPNPKASWVQNCPAIPMILAVGNDRADALEELTYLESRFGGFLRTGKIELPPHRDEECDSILIKCDSDEIVVVNMSDRDIEDAYEAATSRLALVGIAVDRGMIRPSRNPVPGEMLRATRGSMSWLPAICSAGYTPEEIRLALDTTHRRIDVRAPKKRVEKAANDGQASLFGEAL